MAFALFGPAHLAALAAAGCGAWALARACRRAPLAARAVRLGLAAFIVLAAAGFLAHESTWRTLSVWDFAPLHLCDFLVLLAVYALLTRRQQAVELVYFWSGGTALAMITPDLDVGFPHPSFLAYFALHGAVVAAAVVLAFGCGLQPRPGAPVRALLATALYAAAVGAVNVAFGTNFLYLRAKPARPTPLDWLGPWPLYLASAALIAFGLFVAMDWPFRRARRLAQGAKPGLESSK